MRIAVGNTKSKTALCFPNERRRVQSLHVFGVSKSSIRMDSVFVLLYLLSFLGPPSAMSSEPAQISPSISGIVEDETAQPVSGVEVTLFTEVVQRTSTNELGRFRFEGVIAGDYLLSFEKAGFFRVRDYNVRVTSEPAEITVTLNHEYEMHSQVDVVASPHEVDPQQTSHEDQLVAHEIREDPVPSSHTLQNALPAIPGIIQDNIGILHIAGAHAEDTVYLLDGFRMNNPASGLFDARVNVDAVRAVDVVTGRYGAQFGGAAAGVLALQTDTGDDHWRFGATNFFPSLSFQQGTHLGNWFPRTTFSGPIEKGRSWFSDSLSLQHDFTLVSELPQGGNISEDWAGDNLFRAQYNLTPAQSLQASFLYNRESATRSGLGPFAPASTTTDSSTRRYFLSAKDQLVLRRGLLEIGIASDSDRTDRLPQGNATFVLTPTGPEGNYFESLLQSSRRLQSHGDLTLTDRKWHGGHKLQAGFNIDSAHLDRTADRHTVEIRQSDLRTIRTSSFSGEPQLSISEIQAGAYLQDSWQFVRSMIFESSLRVDRNDFVRATLVQPRLIMNWVPQPSTKFSAGWGLYYEPIYLSLIAQSYDQQRIDSFGPPATTILTSFSDRTELNQPYFQTASAEWQQRWGSRTTSAVHVMERDQRDGLVYDNISTDPLRQDLELTNTRRDRYRAVDVSVRRSFRDGADVMIDYTYSRSRSNKIFDYALEDFLLAPQASGPLTWDAPQRVISHGAVQTNIWKLLFSYFGEYHTGFPFSAVNSRYQLSGIPNGFRYPSYFDLNIGAEKRVPFFGYEWAVRLSVINATAHKNFSSVINNVDAPTFLTFAGGQHRAFTARLRLVGRK
ncbi:MAG TPA: TonB-dependent receptor [Terriglobia bacterium]|nr:TonB-dependent receptor [Terriglobia bacterium]